MSSIRVFYLSFGMAIAGYAILLVLMIGGHTVLGALVVPGFLIFAAFGMLTVLTTVFLANTVDYGEMKNHRRDESVIFSMQTFVVKLASGVAVLIAAVCLSLCNLKQDTSAAVVARAADSSVLGLRLTMAGIPMIGLFIAVLVFRKKYILTEKSCRRLMQQLKIRRTAKERMTAMIRKIGQAFVLDTAHTTYAFSILPGTSGASVLRENYSYRASG